MTKNNRNAPKKKRFTHKKRNTYGGHKKRNSKKRLKRLKRLKKGGHAWDDPELQWFNAYKNSHKFLLQSLIQTTNPNTRLIVYETQNDTATGKSIYIGAIKGQSSASMEDTGLENRAADRTNGGIVNAGDAGAATDAYIKNYVFLDSPTPTKPRDSTTPLFTRTTSYTQATEEPKLTKANYYNTLSKDERKYKSITELEFYVYRLEIIKKFGSYLNRNPQFSDDLYIIQQLNDIYTKKNNVLYFSPNQGEVCDTKCVSMESCPYLKLYADTVTIPEHFDTEITTKLKKYNGEPEESKELTTEVLEGDVELIKKLLEELEQTLDIDNLQSYLTHIPTFSMSILPGLSFLELMKYKLQYYGIIVMNDETTDFLNCANDRHMLPSILIKVFRSVPKYFLELLLYNILFDFLNYINLKEKIDGDDAQIFKRIIELYTSKPNDNSILKDIEFDRVSKLDEIPILQIIFESKDISSQFKKDEEKSLNQLDTSDKLKLYECYKFVGNGGVGVDEIIDDYNNYLNPLYLTNMETDDRTKLEIKIRDYNINICEWLKELTLK